MIIKCGRKLFEFVDEICRNRESTALNLLVDLSNSDAELRLQFVTSLGLLLVIRDVILAKDIGSEGLLDIMNTNGREVRLMWIGCATVDARPHV